jgi:phosphatidylserine/phosphatidylglycerophosphate/cardiolipin synthase-like enzyme
MQAVSMKTSLPRALALVFLLLPLPLAAQSSITAVRIPSAVASGGGAGSVGTPYAVFVRIQNWTSGAGALAYVKLYSGGANEWMYSATGVWSNSTTYSTNNQPVVPIDAGGNWAGWIYAKHNTTLGTAVQLRAARVTATGTNVTSGPFTLRVLSMTTTGDGGWLVRPASPAVNRAVAAYAGGTIVGLYRSEDNGITEGYTYGPGGFKIAVPAGLVDSIVAFDDAGQRESAFIGPWVVVAGLETDVTSGGTPGPGTAAVFPRTIQAAVSQTVGLSVYGEAPHVISSVRTVVPPGWNWPRTPAAVSVSGPGTPVVSVNGDTIRVIGLAVPGGDSARIAVSSVIPADTTLVVPFLTSTGTHPDTLRLLAVQPSAFLYGTPRAIGDVKQNDTLGVPLRLNQLVTIRGIVTVANQFGGPSYLQDVSGGIGVFGAAFSDVAAVGDEVLVSGTVEPFFGLCEIVNPVLHRIVGSGNVVEPLVVTAAQIAGDGQRGVELYEGRLVRLNGVSTTATGTWAANTNYPLSDASGTTEIRIDNNTNIVGAPIPGGQFDLVAVAGQFDNTLPYTAGYQVLPRSQADLITVGPLIATPPVETGITPSTLTVQWTTVNPGTSGLRYGRTPALELGVAGQPAPVTSHSVSVAGLPAATVHYMKAFSVSGPDTSYATTLVVSTASPPQATGVINAYFNKSVNPALAWFRPANGNQNLVARLLARVNAARRSVDAALYSLSGPPGDEIALALIAAKNRGVSVRVIAEEDNRNSNAYNAIAAAGIPLITDRFDQINQGAGYHHNKFFVMDGRGGAPESVWVWTGSWNPTDPGTNLDSQNAVEVQDPALANAYVMEFNEMWGSASPVPDAAVSRFGARKTDNTPHRFVIGGKRVECYFSPTDGTTARIAAAISGAQYSAAFATYTLTRSDLANAIIGRKNAGKKVRGVMDNNTDTGTQYPYLLANGVDVRLKTGTSGLLHHKYGIIDAENPGWNALTITGSHNWSNNAENANNENMLFIADGDLTNQFLQEFAARYYQFGGSDSIRVGVDEEAGMPLAFALDQNYPNPFNPATTIRWSVPEQAHITLTVYDLLGRAVMKLADGLFPPGVHLLTWDASSVASGVYFLRMEAGRFSTVRKMTLMR